VCNKRLLSREREREREREMHDYGKCTASCPYYNAPGQQEVGPQIKKAFLIHYRYIVAERVAMIVRYRG
jgi:hypothetical protein